MVIGIVLEPDLMTAVDSAILVVHVAAGAADRVVGVLTAFELEVDVVLEGACCYCGCYC